MGSKFSASEKKEYQDYGRKIDVAVKDNDNYVQFMAVREEILRDISSGKRNTEQYAVDYIKELIKKKGIPEQSKFKALLLLKELMKSKNPKFVNYVNRKFGSRLYLLAADRAGPRALEKFSSRMDPMWASEFHYLLLECWGRWGNELSGINPNFETQRLKLQSAKLVPVAQRFWDIPRPIFEEVNNENESVETLLNKVAHQRVKILSVLEYKGPAELGDPDLEEEIKVYRKDKEELNSNAKAGELLQGRYQQTPENTNLSEQLQNELLMFETIYDNFHSHKNTDANSKRAFLQNVANTHNNMFGTNYDLLKNNRSSYVAEAQVGNQFNGSMGARDRQFLSESELEAQRVRSLKGYARPTIDNPIGGQVQEEELGGIRGNEQIGQPSAGVYENEAVGQLQNQRNNQNGGSSKANYVTNYYISNNEIDKRSKKPSEKSVPPSVVNRANEERTYVTNKYITNTHEIDGEVDFDRNNDRQSRVGSKVVDNYLTNYQTNYQTNYNPKPVERKTENFNAYDSENNKNQKGVQANIELNEIRTNNFRKVTSQQSLFGNDRDIVGTPSKNQQVNTTKDFYKSYFADDRNSSRMRQSGNDGKFITDGLLFVNSMYHNINHTIAPNVA